VAAITRTLGLERLVAAHAVELPVRQHAQQPRLQVERHVADLVEEERAAVGLLEAAAAHGLRAGEGAALVAEQLRLQQVLRDGRRVERHEGAAGARAVLVQRARHQLLAAAALAGDEHRHVALRQAADGAEDVLHGRRLAEHLGHRHLRGVAHRLAHALLHRAVDELHRLGHVEGLGQVLEGAALEGRDGAVEVGVGGHDDDRQLRQARLELRQQVQPRAAGHADVADQHLRLVAVVQRRHDVAGVGEAAHRELLARERLLEHEADRLIVIDDPDGFHAGRCRLGNGQG
jgi:uncharacterized protein YoaH (UPF0181 family)